jgi:hypothetical protein
MRVAVYSHSVAPSIDGVCRRFTALLKELSRQGHEVVLFTLEDNPQDISSVSKFVTLDHMTIPSYPGKKVARPTLRSFSRIFNTLKAFKPEVSRFLHYCARSCHFSSNLQSSLSYMITLAQNFFLLIVQVVHVTADFFSHTFALVGIMLNIPILGSFHTDLIDLLDTHNADPFQKFFINSKEVLDSVVLDSCATTSTSFAVRLTAALIPLSKYTILSC